mgnify:CR=1 FL=1
MMGRLVIIFLFFVFKAFSTGLDSTEVVFKDNEAIIKKDRGVVLLLIMVIM